MSRFIYLITALCCLCPALGARAMTRLWSAGPLTWADFTDVPALPDSRGYLTAELALATEAAQGQPGVYTMRADAVMYPDRSYAPPSARDERTLRYFQARFDLLEVMSRRLRHELAGGVTGLEADRRLAHYRALYATEADKMDRATAWGNDEAALQTWEYDIRRALEETASPAPATVSAGAWCYGLFAGVGGLFPTGTVSDAFSGGCVFTFGLTGGWKGLRVHGSIGYCTPTIRDTGLVNPEYAGQSYLANVKNANMLEIGFGVGYTVADTKHFSVEPYIGGYWTGYNWTARPMTPNDEGSFTTTGPQRRMEIDDFNFGCGVNLEWHFHSAVTSFPLFGNMREQYVSSLRLTPYALHARYTDATRSLGGWQIGFRVCYSGLARTLRLK